MAKYNLEDVLSINAQDIGSCQKRFDVTVNAETVANETSAVVREFTAAAPIHGFRKGKAPRSIIISRYENDIREDLFRRLISAAFSKVSSDKELEIISCDLAETPGELKFDEEFKFAIKVDLAPAVDCGTYTGIKVTVPAAEVKDEEMAERVDYYRVMYGNYEDVTTPAETDDMLKCSYTSDFVLPEKASSSLSRQVNAEDNWLWLSDPEFIPGVNAVLTGATAGNEYEVKAEYPADSRISELAGKTVNYKIKVNAIQRRTKLDDAQLCAKLNIGSIDELKDLIKKSAVQEAENDRRAKVLEAVYAVLDGQIAKFDLPSGVVARETDKELRRMAQEKVRSEADAEAFKNEMEAHRAEALKLAEEKLRRVFIFRKIAKLENITLTKKELDDQIAQMSKYYGYKEKEFRKMLDQNGGFADLELDILNAKVWDFLASKAEVSAE